MDDLEGKLRTSQAEVKDLKKKNDESKKAGEAFKAQMAKMATEMGKVAAEFKV